MAAAFIDTPWKKRAAQLSFRNQAFIGGKYVPAKTGRTFDCISPVDGTTLTQIVECDADDVDRAVTAARSAFETGVWSKRAPADRKRILCRFAKLISANLDELALLETLDMGKPIRDASTIDVPGAAHCIEWYAEASDQVYDEIAPTADSALALITREPLGVVGAVAPSSASVSGARSWRTSGIGASRSVQISHCISRIE